MSHLVLLGDSIFDNRAYTGGQPDVVAHLNELLPAGWRATLRAVDGATTIELASQCSRVPSDASHVVVSIGGNDSIENSDLLATPVGSTAEALALFDDRISRFEAKYRAALGAVRALQLPTTVCTIYDGNFSDETAKATRVALMMFNDVILRVAFELRLTVIDLRAVCNEAEDYANPIEPSGPGGRRIAAAIVRATVVGSGGDTDSRVVAG